MTIHVNFYDLWHIFFSMVLKNVTIIIFTLNKYNLNINKYVDDKISLKLKINNK